MKSSNRCYMKTVTSHTFKRIFEEWRELFDISADSDEMTPERSKRVDLEKKLSGYGFASMTKSLYDEKSQKLIEQYIVNYYRNYLNPWHDKGTCAYKVYKLMCRHHPSRSCMSWNRRALRWLCSHRWMDYSSMAPESYQAHKASSRKERKMLEKLAVLYQWNLSKLAP